MAPIVTKAQATLAVGWLLIGLYWIYQGITTGPSVLKLLVGLVCCLIGAANGSAVLQRSAHLQLPPLPAAPAWARLPRRTPRSTPTPEPSGAKKWGPGEESLPAQASTASPSTKPIPRLERDSITPARQFAQADSPVPGPQWVPAPQIRSAPQGQPARPITSTQDGSSAEPSPWAAVTPATPWRLPRPIDPAPIPQWAPGPVEPNPVDQAPEPEAGPPAPVQPLRRPRSGRRSAT